MSNDHKTTFFGMPISGEIQRSHKSIVEQRPAEQLHALLVEILEDDKVEAVRWEQYTPYFNDGEPCKFSVRDIFVKRTDIHEGDEEIGDYADGFTYVGDPTVRGGRMTRFQRDADGGYGGSTVEYGEPYEPLASKDLLGELADRTGAFEDAMRTTFGDHAQVTVTRDGIEIEEYEHE